MALPLTCIVTVTLDAFVNTIPPLPPVTVPVGVDLITDVPFPEDGGEVEIDLFPLLGVVDTITVPCPSVTTTSIDVSPTLTADLTITVTEAP